MVETIFFHRVFYSFCKEVTLSLREMRNQKFLVTGPSLARWGREVAVQSVGLWSTHPFWEERWTVTFCAGRVPALHMGTAPNCRMEFSLRAPKGIGKRRI